MMLILGKGAIILETLNSLNRHMRNTGETASDFGTYLKLSYKEIDDLYVSGILHDVGKVYVPEVILDKPTRLSKKDFEEIKKHPIYSKRIISKNNYNYKIIEGVLQHHERIDGKGYPLGIKGDRISVIGKILAICDSYDAMIGKRVYQSQKSKQEALEEIRKNLRTQFDEELGLCFLKFASISL